MPAPDFGLGGSRTAHGVSAAAPLPQPRTSGFSLPSPSFGTGSMTGTPINVKVAEPLFKHIPASTKIIPAAASTGSALASAAGAVGSALAKGASSAFGAFNGVFNSPLAKAGWPTTQPAQTVTIPARRVAIAPPVATPKSPWNGQFLSAPPTGATNANTYYDATTGKWQGYQPSAVASNGFRSGSNWSGYSSPPPAGASNSNTYYDRTTGTWGAY